MLAGIVLLGVGCSENSKSPSKKSKSTIVKEITKKSVELLIEETQPFDFNTDFGSPK